MIIQKKYLKQQNIKLQNVNNFGTIELSYLDQKGETDNAINEDLETLNYQYLSKKINKYSQISLNGLYNLKRVIILNMV